MTSKDILTFTLKAISDRHGENTVAYDMQGYSILADYYVATSAGSNRQLHAIANAIIDAAHLANFNDYRVEGSSESNWLLLDLGDVVVNVFTEEARDFYNVEKLWTDGKKIEIKED
ncbi:ribosome-associated protein [Lactobacillus bombicola]|uniref:Ribosomal silencing factor RsfS n=1 Tax=Lactobacillus bombicola TaxID=1505723 RepID=A0A1I1SGS0_9LACO|nr:MULTISPECIES: ribosome silencing factor [Lactobacillus]MCO6528006.1 ribosome silencing factor [Lactobacillus sp.]RMC39137.1 ribosome silencing factor [Lactobacillus sp. ESL0237]RMC41795.1 ribosome silencing factor [Lactobacillus sp. ESL0233]RMC43420.1 ribosome silencing factor [Lactobacillus sp. ESL0234]RMC44332.1 ribosome silencing factor [Lactobacillus sp. ESL0236]